MINSSFDWTLGMLLLWATVSLEMVRISDPINQFDTSSNSKGLNTIS